MTARWLQKHTSLLTKNSLSFTPDHKSQRVTDSRSLHINISKRSRSILVLHIREDTSEPSPAILRIQNFNAGKPPYDLVRVKCLVPWSKLESKSPDTSCIMCPADYSLACR